MKTAVTFAACKQHAGVRQVSLHCKQINDNSWGGEHFSDAEACLLAHLHACRYKHVPGVIHIKRDSLVLKHRPWHTMLRSSVTDHSMRKYSTGVYKHMPGGLEAHLSFFTAAPVAVGKLGYKAAHAARQAVIDTQGAFGGNGKGQGSSGGGSATDEGE